RAPLLSQQQQNRRNQSARVADADPPDKVQDVQSPADRNVDAPKTDPFEQKLCDRQQQQLEKHKRDRKTDKPAQRRRALQDDRADLVRDGSKRQLWANDGMRRVN